MDIKQIKNRADSLLVDCKPQVMRTLIIMLLIGAIPSLVGYKNFLFSFISMLVGILYVPFSHGQIVTALKVVRNNKSALSDDDALVGFNRFKELFVTYFLTGLFVIIVAFILVFIGAMVFMMLYGTSLAWFSTFSMSSSVDVSSFFELISALGIFGSTLAVGLVFLALIIVAAMAFLSIYLFAVPYLLEQYNIKGLDAIKESFSFIKGNVWNLIKLQLSFIGWIILFAILESILADLLAFIPVLGIVIATIVVGALAIYVYMPKYIVSMAIFFEEIAYYRYNQNQ